MKILQMRAIGDYEVEIRGSDDSRFGVIDVLSRRGDPEDLIFAKRKKSLTLEEHQAALASSAERLELQSPYILRMIGVTEDERSLTVETFFDYPAENLVSRREALRSPAHQLKFLHDSLQGLAYLEGKRMVHGNVRPEYISYCSKEDRYVLLDRLNDVLPPMQSHFNSIRFGGRVFLPPEIFTELCRRNLAVRHNPFKTEVFCLAMAFLWLLFDDDEEFQSIYDSSNGIFDEAKFQEIVSQLTARFYSRGRAVELGSLVLGSLASLDPGRRLRPSAALSALRLFAAKLAPLPLDKITLDFGHKESILEDFFESRLPVMNITSNYQSKAHDTVLGSLPVPNPGSPGTFEELMDLKEHSPNKKEEVEVQEKNFRSEYIEQREEEEREDQGSGREERKIILELCDGGRYGIEACAVEEEGNSVREVGDARVHLDFRDSGSNPLIEVTEIGDRFSNEPDDVYARYPEANEEEEEEENEEDPDQRDGQWEESPLTETALFESEGRVKAPLTGSAKLEGLAPTRYFRAFSDNLETPGKQVFAVHSEPLSHLRAVEARAVGAPEVFCRQILLSAIDDAFSLLGTSNRHPSLKNLLENKNYFTFTGSKQTPTSSGRESAFLSSQKEKKKLFDAKKSSDFSQIDENDCAIISDSLERNPFQNLASCSVPYENIIREEPELSDMKESDFQIADGRMSREMSGGASRRIGKIGLEDPEKRTESDDDEVQKAIKDIIYEDLHGERKASAKDGNDSPQVALQPRPSKELCEIVDYSSNCPSELTKVSKLGRGLDPLMELKESNGLKNSQSLKIRSKKSFLEEEREGSHRVSSISGARNRLDRASGLLGGVRESIDRAIQTAGVDAIESISIGVNTSITSSFPTLRELASRVFFSKATQTDFPESNKFLQSVPISPKPLPSNSPSAQTSPQKIPLRHTCSRFLNQPVSPSRISSSDQKASHLCGNHPIADPSTAASTFGSTGQPQNFSNHLISFSNKIGLNPSDLLSSFNIKPAIIHPREKSPLFASAYTGYTPSNEHQGHCQVAFSGPTDPIRQPALLSPSKQPSLSPLSWKNHNFKSPYVISSGDLGKK